MNDRDRRAGRRSTWLLLLVASALLAGCGSTTPSFSATTGTTDAVGPSSTASAMVTRPGASAIPTGSTPSGSASSSTLAGCPAEPLSVATSRRPQPGEAPRVLRQPNGLVRSRRRDDGLCRHIRRQPAQLAPRPRHLLPLRRQGAVPMARRCLSAGLRTDMRQRAFSRARLSAERPLRRPGSRDVPELDGGLRHWSSSPGPDRRLRLSVPDAVRRDRPFADRRGDRRAVDDARDRVRPLRGADRPRRRRRRHPVGHRRAARRDGRPTPDG